MVCPRCGTQVADAQLQCPNCGSALVPPGPPPLPAKTGSNKTVWWIVGCAVAIPVGIAVLGIVAAIFIPNFLDALQKAKQKRAMADLQTIGRAVEVYKTQHGFAPSADTIDALASQLGGSTAVPRIDPWTHPYRYGCWQEESTSGCDHYRIASGGRDGRFEQDDLQGYEPGRFEPRLFDRDIVFGDGSLIFGPGRPQ